MRVILTDKYEIVHRTGLFHMTRIDEMSDTAYKGLRTWE